MVPRSTGSYAPNIGHSDSLNLPSEADVLGTSAATMVVGFDADAPDFFWLAGQGGYGIMMAPALGHAAAGLIVDGTLPDDLRASELVEAEISPSRAALAK